MDGAKVYLRKAASFAALFAVYVWIALFLLDREQVWMQPEALAIASYALSNGNALQPNDLVRALNRHELEFSRRAGRPFSSFLQIADVKIRASLWREISPHPSLSLTWLLTLGLTPLFFFLLLRRFGVEACAARWATALFLASPATLSLVAMYFRPAKALSLFFFALLLYLGACYRDSRGTRLRQAIAVLLLVSFLCDETAFLIYPALLLLYPELKAGKPWWRTLWIPALGIFLCAILFPVLAQLLHLDPPNAFEGTEVVSLPPPNLFVKSISLGLWLTLKDTLALFPPWLPPSPLGKAILIVNAVVLVVGGVMCARGKAVRPARGVVGFAVMAVAFHLCLMAIVSNRYWGLYWYGGYVVIATTLLLTLVLGNGVRELVFASLILSFLYTFPFTNSAYRFLHYYPCDPLALREIFLDRVNRFALYPPKIRPEVGTEVPAERLFIPVELHQFDMATAKKLSAEVRTGGRRSFLAPRE